MRKLLKTSIHIAVISLLSLGFVGRADAEGVSFDFEQKFFYEFGFEIKDHCLVRDGSTYHLFYLRGVLGYPAIDIGHATSPDLKNWTMHPPLLYTGPDPWDGRALWAPQVVPVPGQPGAHFMYYTGVNFNWTQQTGLAFSTSGLGSWSKFPQPIYHPDPSWAMWGDTLIFAAGRDPYVFEYEGTHYMINTAKTIANKGAIACASSPDLFNWTDIGPLYVHNNWHVLESNYLVQRNDKFHLFFTEEVVNGTSHMASNALFSGWEIGSRTIIDAGHAPEINTFDEGDYVFSRHTTYYDSSSTYHWVIRFDTLLWAGDTPFVYKPWPLADNWTIVWGNAFIYQPTFLNNPALRGEPIEVGFEGNSWLSSYEKYQGPLGAASTPGGYYGDGAKGLLRSKTFTITCNSINLLVGGGNDLNLCYVALKDANTQQVLFKETGKNSDVMDRRYWDLQLLSGRQVYIEIMDNSTAPFGHISCDDIRESADLLNPPGDPENDEPPDNRKFEFGKIQKDDGPGAGKISEVTLFQNHPNPFNPITTISFYLPAEGLVTLDVFDVNGKRIQQLVNRTAGEGTHTVRWNGTNLNNERVSTGIYFYRLAVNGRLFDTKKMVMLK
jgi:predicted GH43/DUF377 family glycosyl hydrolase